MSQPAAYTTTSEIAFIDGLGCHSSLATARSTLLQRYLKAAKRRVNWGSIDRQQAIAHATQCLGGLIGE